MGGLIGGAIGRNLGEIERQRADDASMMAMFTGRRTASRGDRGNYGYIEPAALIYGMARKSIAANSPTRSSWMGSRTAPSSRPAASPMAAG
jgi:hypothetical protein